MPIKNPRSPGNDFETQFSILLTHPAIPRCTDCTVTCCVTGTEDQEERAGTEETLLLLTTTFCL